VRRYPVSRLVEWGWLVPQYTLRFPSDFFRTWKNYPYGGDEQHAKHFRLQHILWDSEWFIDSEDEPYWFLHPFFREDDESGKMLRSSTSVAPSGRDTLSHENDRTIYTIAHFFFHWQGYALIDVIHFADCNVSLFNTPNIEQEAAGIAKVVDIMKQIDSTDILRMPKRWGKHSAPMTWLSHYRALSGAIAPLRFDDANELETRQRGARLLATHLGVTEEKLESAIKDSFLVLASQWHWKDDLRSKWIAGAWYELRKDILLAVEWLCILNGRTLDFYLDKWHYKHWGQEDWMELRRVLPVESFSARDDFIKLAPMYLKTYNEVAPEDRALSEDSLKPLVDKLRKTNYPFGSLLHAFRELHEALTYRANDYKKLEFRERRPIDYYLLMGIRVETVLRYALEEEGVLSSMDDSELGLKSYIVQRGKERGISEHALECFRQSEKRYTKLRNTPQEPIAEIMRMQSTLSSKEHYLVQAFLCSILARNYFAHHYYLDGVLLRSNASHFMLGGILVTALTLA